MTRFAISIGLDSIGSGTCHMLSYGVNPQPGKGVATRWPPDSSMAIPAVEPLDQGQINEHVRHSWFLDYPGGRHPWREKRYRTICRVPTATPGARHRAMVTGSCRQGRWRSCVSPLIR